MLRNAHSVGKGLTRFRALQMPRLVISCIYISFMVCIIASDSGNVKRRIKSRKSPTPDLYAINCILASLVTQWLRSIASSSPPFWLGHFKRSSQAKVKLASLTVKRPFEYSLLYLTSAI